MAKHKKGCKFSFGKSVADAQWMEFFVQMLSYKLAWWKTSGLKSINGIPAARFVIAVGIKIRIQKTYRFARDVFGMWDTSSS